jgi:Fe-S-cluster-containing dehydrogenase component
VDTQDEKNEILQRFLRSPGPNHPVTRRRFLQLSGITIVGISALSPLIARGSVKPLIIMKQAQGIVIADPTKCVACRRCELACTEFNDGKAKPSMARIKLARNMNFGPKGAYAGLNGEGNWGRGLVTQDVCKQCPHPVPCADACPNDAITVNPPVNARVVDPWKCLGCRMCQKACPWEMMSFETDTKTATKCFLCDGKPKCVEACPAEALTYAPWRDLTDKVPVRISTAAMIPAKKAAACYECHKK